MKIRNKIVFANYNNYGTLFFFIVHRSDRYATEEIKISLKIENHS